MTLRSLLPQVLALPRADRYQLIQVLVAEMAHEDGVPLLRSDVEYRVDSQYDAQDAAEALQRLLDAQKSTP